MTISEREAARLVELLGIWAVEREARGRVVGTFKYDDHLRTIEYNAVPPDYVPDETLLRALAARLPELLRDAERLGWLENGAALTSIRNSMRDWTWWKAPDLSLRSWIDALLAIAASSPSPVPPPAEAGAP